MSIVDTWGWDKLNINDFRDEFKMTADMKVRTALREFYNNCNIWPNKIIMGYHLVNELHKQFCTEVRSFEEVIAINNGDLKCEYEGIPIDVDHDNPDVLEVGYMVKWMNSKY